MRWVYSPFARWWLARLDMAEGTRTAMTGTPANEKVDQQLDQAKQVDVKVREQWRLSKKEQRIRDRVVTRFSEQGWTCTYATVFWSFGFFLLHRVPINPFSSRYLWENYPHTPLHPINKFYYLAQIGFWFHQLVILNLEARRKDFWQMLAHHFVTIALVVGSYYANYTRVGTLILVLMDFCDIFLPLAKLFRYMSLPTLTDATFVVFLISWLITRQIGFLVVILSCIFRAREIIPKCWNAGEGRYATEWVINSFSFLLIILLGMCGMWFWMACRVAWRVIMGMGAEDVRSDDEDDFPESDDQTQSGVSGDLLTSDGKDQVHPHQKKTNLSSTKAVKGAESKPI